MAGGMRVESYLMSREFQFYNTKIIMEMDGGHGSTTL